MAKRAEQSFVIHWSCRVVPGRNFMRLTWLVCNLLFWTGNTLAQNQEPLPPSSELKKMSVEELMNVEVTSVSKRPEKLSETASAIQIITQADIRRSGATSLPEALRLAPNLQVAQVNSHDWAITARGFNGAPLSNSSLANKLLVMIDGRSVYTPLFGGVFWDVQQVLLEDVDRIEVVSGPGGTLWGANAVNGVINIVTKSAKESQGWYVSGAGGSFLQDSSAVRFGWNTDSDFSARMYVQRFDRNSTTLVNGNDARDAWDLTQGGFRFDYEPSQANTFTLQGDFYAGDEGEPTDVGVNGQNVLGRWTHGSSDQSDFSLQLYFDRTWRDLPNSRFREDLRTYDIDFQHRVPLATRYNLLWGAGYRLMQDDIRNIAQSSFFPARRDLQLFSLFLHNEFTLVPNRLKLALGTKLEHNDYSRFEIQPSGRITWTLPEEQTLWGAVSRAVRSPSRFDTDFFTPSFAGGDKFKSEKVMAYEVGYRIQPIPSLSLSTATFYNRYDDIRSVNLTPKTPPSLVFANDLRAMSWGAEVSGNYQVRSWWRLRGGYTYLNQSFQTTSPRVFPGSETFESDDPHHQFMIQSILDLPKNVQLDWVTRAVSSLPPTLLTPRIPAYFSLDLRLAWQIRKTELSLVGQNLSNRRHLEFGSPGVGREIPRSLYGKVTFRW